MTGIAIWCDAPDRRTKKFSGASDASLAIRSRVAMWSFVREVFESKGLSVGDKQIGY